MNQLQLAPLNGLSGFPPNSQHVPPTRIFGAIGRHRLIAVLVTTGLFIPATAFIETMKPYYTATSMLMVGTRQASFRDMQATVSSPDVDAVAINTQVGILRSAGIARAVAERLNLVADPEFSDALDAVPLKTRVITEVEKLVGYAPPAGRPLTASERLQATALLLSNKVSILNDGRSYIITITAKTGDPVSSARIANAYADAYFDSRRHMKVAATWRANALLDEQIVPLRARLREAEQAVESFREKNGLISARLEHQPGTLEADAPTVADEQLQRMNQELIVAQAALEEKRSRYSEVREAERTGTLANLPDVVSAPLIQQLQTQQSQLSSRVSSLGRSVLDGNPEMQAAVAAASQVRRQIGAETARIADSIAKDVSGAQTRVTALSHAVDALQKQVTGENQANVTLRQLESEANAARAVYQDYLGRFAQTSTQAEMQEAEAELISRAETPLGYSGPPRTQYMAIALLVSMLCGTGAAMLADRIRKGIRTTSQLDSVPGLFTLGMVPAFNGALVRHYRSAAAGVSSVYVETIENIRSILCFGHSRFRAKVVLVTSARPGEGKTTFAVSLAANTGRDLQRALVIDCDTRNPSALGTLGKTDQTADNALPVNLSTGGLARNVMPGVDILTVRPPGERNYAMVSPMELSRILTQFSPHYDMIILDTPPILAFPDAAVLAQQTDGIVMVVKWGLTGSAELTEAMRILHAYDARVLGSVLTQVPSRGLEKTEKRQLGIYRQYGLLSS
jgi:polysaccharide biosynthesis transport protein